jgi:CubicO group peptidase (beta-lactamase class C family)
VSGLRRAFEAVLGRERDTGAAVSVWRGGEEEEEFFFGGGAHSADGEEWKRDTLVLLWSATKGPSASCVLHAAEAAGAEMSTPVSDFWPAFAGGGKGRVTLGEVLSHRAGICAIDEEGLGLLEHDRVVAAIERQAPLVPVGGASAYGPRIHGYVLDEIVRRLSGGFTLGRYWRRHIADPLDLDLWIGLPPEHHHRVARMVPAKIRPGEAPADGFAKAMAESGSLTRKAFLSPGGLVAISKINSPPVWQAGLPAFGGVGTASALAKFHAVLASGGEFGGRRIFGAKACRWMEERLVQGFDEVLRVSTAFSAGFMMNPLDGDGRCLRTVLGPGVRSFGHPGAGGSLGFADPEWGIGFAFVMNGMDPGVLPGERCASLVEAVYAG